MNVMYKNLGFQQRSDLRKIKELKELLNTIQVSAANDYRNILF